MESFFLAIIVGVFIAISSQLKKSNKNTSPVPFLLNRLKPPEVKKNSNKNSTVPTKAVQQKTPLSSRGMRSNDGYSNNNIHKNESFSRISSPLETESPIYSPEDSEQKKLIDAVIWSEILGPPRSKKPHFTRKNT